MKLVRAHQSTRYCVQKLTLLNSTHYLPLWNIDNQLLVVFLRPNVTTASFRGKAECIDEVASTDTLFLQRQYSGVSGCAHFAVFPGGRRGKGRTGRVATP